MVLASSNPPTSAAPEAGSQRAPTGYPSRTSDRGVVAPSKWSQARWPLGTCPWLLPEAVARICPPRYADEASLEQVRGYLSRRVWLWPGQETVLLTDLHADADAFLDSVEAAGMIHRRGPGRQDIEVTPRGSTAKLILAGDFLDKGPHNLDLLRAVKSVRDAGAQLIILAGNHDVRTLVGVSCFGAQDPGLSHMFVRMGKKSVKLFSEIHQGYTKGRAHEYHALNDAAIHQAINPRDGWHEAFPPVARKYVSEAKIARELVRIEEKREQLREAIHDAGMSLVVYYAAVCAFRHLFLDEDGEFAWLFSEMKLAHREGAVLFLHAGVDDSIAELIRRKGHDSLNMAFQDLKARGAWFELYNGPVGNVFRTKYRDSEPPMTEAGVRDLNARGILAIAHGHRNITLGQRMIFRQGLLNFECDASIDRNTRALTGLSARGAAATVFRNDGSVVAVSSDYPSCKVFEPSQFCAVTVA